MTIPAATCLLGVDVGFSERRPTTGIAWLVDGEVQALKTYSDWERRQARLPMRNEFDVVAIDGPILPSGAGDNLERQCERIFVRGAFQRRCKPGLSHFGFGLNLRRATNETLGQLKHLASIAPSTFGPAVVSGHSIVEAFPNAFLGVLLTDEAFSIGKPRKRKKFDWLYDHAIREGVFEKLLRALSWQSDRLLGMLQRERDHEKRAALICLLTAACAATAMAHVVGDKLGGYFWLPPESLWADWAQEALAQNGASPADRKSSSATAQKAC